MIEQNIIDISGLPLVELHCHLEGTVQPMLALKLAARHELDLSSVINSEGNYIWSDFDTFIFAYDSMSKAVCTAEDHYDITYAYYSDAAAKGLRYGEVFVSPAHALEQGLSYTSLIDAVAAAMSDVESETGTVARINLTCVRHFGADHAEEVARMAERSPHSHVVGFGMAGAEGYGSAEDYAHAFEIAKGAGLHTTAHAGELAGPESIRDVIDHLDVERIGHGVRCSEDPTLLRELVSRQLLLEICPSSNVAMSVVPSLEEHPVRDYLRAGLKVALNTDDPPFFDTDIRREYRLVAETFGLERKAMAQFSKNAVSAAFCDRGTRDRLLDEIDRWVG